MGIRESLAGWFGGKAEPIPQQFALVVKPAPSADQSAQMGIMDGADGRRAMAWTNTHYNGWGHGYPGYRFGGAPGWEIARERSTASALSSEMVTTNSVIATLVENLGTQAVGNGLTLSAKPDHVALRISPEEARKLSDVIERKWRRWSSNPLECDASGRHTLHQLATASFKSYLLTGESVVAIDWRPVKGATTRTKIKLLDSRQIDQSKTQVNASGSVVQGVAFDKGGRVTGYYILPYELGALSYTPITKYVPAHTSWGRPRILHLFDPIVPGQLRGLSPLAATLTPAQTKGVLREYTVAAAFVQTMFAASVESDLPDALKGLNANKGHDAPLGGWSGSPEPQTTGPNDWLAAHAAYYGADNKVSLNPGVVNHLYKGDSLKIHRSEAPNATYESFDKSLLREGAKAAGASFEDTSGDYSQTSFSASRLALDLPGRINDRRREAIVVRFYKAAYRCWLEEQFETGAIVLPKGAPAFWEAVDAYTESKWRGKGKAVADPLKQAQADILEIENGLSTLEEKLGERGLDFEEVVTQRAAERRELEKVGLYFPVPKNRDDWKPEEDAAVRP